MSTNWSRGGQPSSAIQNNGSNYPSGPPMQSNGPPPICFNCGNEGHFMVACPEPIRSTSAGLPAARAPDGTPPDSNGNADGSGAQRPQWANGQKGAVVTRYPVPKHAPVVTRYAIPTKPPQYGNNGGSYGPPNTPYQQYPGPAPQTQAYPPQGPPEPASYSPYPLNQQYGPPGPQYPYNQQQPYNGSPTPQYGNQGYQPPPYNQYPPPNEPQQYGGPGYQNSPQQYGPLPAGPPYQPPGNPYPPQNGGYGESYRRPSAPYQAPPPQWNNTPPVPPPHSAPPYQRQHSNHSHCDGGYQREYSRTPSHQPNPQWAQDYGHGSEGYQQTPQTPASNYSNLQRPAQASQSSPVNVPYESRSSSRASTPYARRGSTSSSTRKGRMAESTTPTGIGNQEPAESQDGKEQADDDEQEFNWEFKKIFMEPEKQEWVALAQPLSTTFDMTPVPLLDMRSTNSVSRYARKENLKEFTRSIRSAPQWSYLKEDPAFSDSELHGPLIPFHEIPGWTAARHGTEELPENRRPSRKRAWSDEQDDVDNQIKLESANLDTPGLHAEDQQEGQPKTKRQKNEETREQQLFADASPERPGTPTATAGTPVLGRAGTPSFGADDDVWAPQPGEGAESAPVDPTEALLASLGVSGSPKPVQEEPLPPFLSSTAEDHFQAPPDPALVPTLTRHSSFDNATYPPNSHPNPQYGNGHPIKPPYANTHRGDPQYGNGPPVPNPSYPNGPHVIPQYNNQSPVYPPYYNAPHGNTQYGSTGNMPYPNGPPLQRQYSSGPANPQYGKNGDSQYMNGPPVNSQFNPGPHGTPPLRQDSGYVSARGSYSNDSGQHDFSRRRNSQVECQQQPPSHAKRIDTSVGTTFKENTSQKADQKQDSDAEKSESPLSLIERELLYPKLTAAPSKSKKPELQRQVDDVGRKKRQPVVAEAYSRRW